MFKTLIRPAMIFVPLTLGMLCPRAAEFDYLIRYFLMTMLFVVYLGLDVREIKLKKSHFILLAVNILMGCAAYWGVKLFSNNEALAQAAFFVGITPTATAATVVMNFLGGKVGYVLTAFAVTNIGVACVMPWLLGMVCGNSSAEFILRVTETLFYLLVLPYITALIVQKIYPPARELPGKIRTATFSLWSLSLFIIAAEAAEFFQQNPDVSGWVVLEIALVSLLVCVLNFAIGYRVGEKDFRRESSQSLGQKNTTLTIYLALVYAGPLPAMGVISYVLWHNSWNAIQMFVHDRRKISGETGQKK